MRRFFSTVALYLFQAGFVLPLLYWFVGVRYRRRHTVPKGPCLVVANHNSHLDAAVLMHIFPFRRVGHVHPVAAADYFGSNWIRRMMAMLFMNAIAIQRRPVAGQDPLRPVKDALVAGESLIFFPEGSRGEAGVIAPFRPGIGRLVRELPGLLVVPVFLSGPERIWPRGQVVPVPLGIDVNIGRARTYSPELSARAIAEQVRADVVALAPPPPPLPEGRPSPPKRIAVCGIEREFRREVFRALTAGFGTRAKTIGLADPVLEADDEGLREIAGPVPLSRSRAWLRLLASVVPTSGRFRGEKFTEMVERSAVDEALDHGRAARFVVGGGNALVDLLAWAEADFYKGVFDEEDLGRLMLYLSRERRIPVRRWWKLARKTPEIWLLNVFDLARLRVPDVVVFLRSSPAGVMQGLRSRGHRLERFETERSLAQMQDGYARVLSVLGRKRRTAVLEFEAGSAPPGVIAGHVLERCENLLEPDPATAGKH